MYRHAHSRLLVVALSAMLPLVACSDPRPPSLRVALPGGLGRSLDAKFQERLVVTFELERVGESGSGALLAPTELALQRDTGEVSGDFDFGQAGITGDTTAAYTLAVWLEEDAADDDGAPRARALLAEATGTVVLRPNQGAEVVIGADAYESCGAKAGSTRCSPRFDLNRNKLSNLADVVAGREPFPPPRYIDVAPATLQFPSGIRLGDFARQVIVVENPSARPVNVRANLVDAPGASLARVDVIVREGEEATDAPRELELGTLQPYDEAFLAVSFAPINEYLMTGSVYVVAYDPVSRTEQAARIKIIGNAEGSLQPPDVGYDPAPVADGAVLGGYTGRVQRFPTANLFNGLAVTDVEGTEARESGLKATGQRLTASFTVSEADESGALVSRVSDETVPADAVFLLELPAKNRFSVGLGDIAADMSVAVVELGENDAIVADGARNFLSDRGDDSPEALEVFNESTTPRRLLVVLGRIDNQEEPSAADAAVSSGGQALTLALDEAEPFALTGHLSAPTEILSVTPAEGAIEGGASVVVEGLGLHPEATLLFAGSPALDCAHEKLDDDTDRFTCITPPGSLEQGKNPATLVVKNPEPDDGGNGQAATLSEAYTYVPRPRIDLANPRVAPTSGSVNDIVIHGAYFSKRYGLPIVRFGDVEATAVEYVDAGELRVKAPAQGAGEVLLGVTNHREPQLVDGVEVPVLSEPSNQLQFEYVVTSAPAPTLTSVAPTSGSIDGGTLVTLSGTGFQVGAVVTFDGALATDVTFLGEQALQARTPPRESDDSVDVEVVNPDGQSALLAQAFGYVIPPPAVSSVFPKEASTKGGTFVVVSGSGFRAGVVVDFVAADGTALPSANVNRASSTTLLVATPMVPAGGDYTVRVTNVGGAIAAFDGVFRYLAPTGPAPRLVSVDPPVGFREAPSPVSLRGKNFRGPPAVLFGNEPAEVVNFDDSDVQNAVVDVLAPASAFEGPVVVRLINNDGQSDTSVYTYVTNLDAPPQVFQVVPPEGGPGTLVTIKGAGFAADVVTGMLASGAKLLVRGAPVQPSAATSSEVRFVMPTLLTSLAANVELTVENPDEQRASGSFRYRLPPPSLTQVAPAAGTVGTQVSVTGSGLDVTSVAVGPIALAAGDFSATPTMVEFTVPSSLAPAQVQIRVTNRDGQSATIPFTVVEETPGTATLLRAVTLAVGDTACPNGGRRLESGVDVDKDGQLDELEVDPASVTYLCNPEAATGSAVTLVRSSPISPGDEFCPSGGTLLQAGLDLDFDGVLDENEVDPASVTRQCNAPPTEPNSAEAGFVFPDVAHAEIPGDVLTVTGQGLGPVTSVRVVQFSSPSTFTEVAAATLRAKLNTAVQVELTTALPPTHTEPPYQLELSWNDAQGNPIRLYSLPFVAERPMIRLLVEDHEYQMGVLGEGFFPQMLQGLSVVVRNGTVEKGVFPLALFDKGETTLRAQKPMDLGAPGNTLHFLFHYANVATPIEPVMPPLRNDSIAAEAGAPLLIEPASLTTGETLQLVAYACLPDVVPAEWGTPDGVRVWGFTGTSEVEVASGSWSVTGFGNGPPVDGGTFDGGTFDGGTFDGGTFDGGTFDGGTVTVPANCAGPDCPPQDPAATECERVIAVDLGVSAGQSLTSDLSYKVVLASTESEQLITYEGVLVQQRRLTTVPTSSVVARTRFGATGYLEPSDRIVATNGNDFEVLDALLSPGGGMTLWAPPFVGSNVAVCVLSDSVVPTATVCVGRPTLALDVIAHPCKDTPGEANTFEGSPTGVRLGGRFSVPLTRASTTNCEGAEPTPGYEGRLYFDPPESLESGAYVGETSGYQWGVRLVGASATQEIYGTVEPDNSLNDPQSCALPPSSCELVPQELFWGEPNYGFIGRHQIRLWKANATPNEEVEFEVIFRDSLDGSCLSPDRDGDGLTPCVGDCNDENPAINAGAPEDCATPEIDDNCDGDPDLIGPCSTGLAGLCGEGESRCSTPSECPVSLSVGEAVELCSTGADEDCDGIVDEGDGGPDPCDCAEMPMPMGSGISQYLPQAGDSMVFSGTYFPTTQTCYPNATLKLGCGTEVYTYGWTTNPAWVVQAGQILIPADAGALLSGTEPYCEAYLHIDDFAEPVYAGYVTLQRCGDGNLDSPYEQCDDGATLPGDGCDEFCNIDCGSFPYTGVGSCPGDCSEVLPSCSGTVDCTSFLDQSSCDAVGPSVCTWDGSACTPLTPECSVVDPALCGSVLGCTATLGSCTSQG